MKALNTPLMFLSVLLSFNCALGGPQSTTVEAREQAATNFAQQTPDSQTPEDVRQIIEGLPSCSFLHQQLIAGIYGKGTMQSYMEAMRREGVKKAVFVVQAHWDGKQPKEPRLLNGLYFDSYDGPNGQIVAERLEGIRKSGLEDDGGRGKGRS